MEQWQEGGKVVRKKCLRPPAQPFPLGLMAGRLSPQIQVSFHRGRIYSFSYRVTPGLKSPPTKTDMTQVVHSDFSSAEPAKHTSLRILTEDANCTQPKTVGLQKIRARPAMSQSLDRMLGARKVEYCVFSYRFVSCEALSAANGYLPRHPL